MLDTVKDIRWNHYSLPVCLLKFKILPFPKELLHRTLIFRSFLQRLLKVHSNLVTKGFGMTCVNCLTPAFLVKLGKRKGQEPCHLFIGSDISRNFSLIASCMETAQTVSSVSPFFPVCRQDSNYHLLKTWRNPFRVQLEFLIWLIDPASCLYFSACSQWYAPWGLPWCSSG